MTLPGHLLVDVQRRLEAFYALEPHAPVTDFVIPQEEAEQYPGGGSRTLIKEDGDEISVGVVLDEATARGLRERDPRVRLDGSNLGPFATLTEEVSHFVYLLFCAQAQRSVTQLELELQAEVDKYLTAATFFALQHEGALAPGLRQALFRRYRLVDGLTPERVERYRAASELADRYCGWLEAAFVRPGRHADLAREARRFYRLGQREKLARIARM
ncbi:MAG TPA: hypothetical protein VMX54_21805 [Vicinamibacteria bacterium]|nr:hypothetical protein [Vicinamibacteria bacterium]